MAKGVRTRTSRNHQETWEKANAILKMGKTMPVSLSGLDKDLPKPVSNLRMKKASM